MTVTSKTIKKVTVSWTTKTGERKTAERWQARYRDPFGGQPKKNFDRKVDAQQWLDQQVASVVTGRYVDPRAGKVTLQQFYDDWKANQIWKASTRENADLAVQGCTFKDLPLKMVRKSHVEGWVKQMDLTLAPTTIETRFVVIRSILRAAVADKVIAEDPSTGVVLPQKQKTAAAMQIPTPTQVGLILANADQATRKSTRVGFRAYVALCAFAGLRKGEALGVQVGDIDFMRRRLTIDRQIQRAKTEDIERGKHLVEATGGTTAVVTDPKRGSKRTIFLPDELILILGEHVAMHTPDGDPDRWLFADDEGRPWHDNSVTWRWRGARTAAGVSTRLHDLRHYYASGLIAAGCDVVTVANALGHANTSTTHQTYLHLWHSAEDGTREAASSLAREALPTGHELGTEESKEAK